MNEMSKQEKLKSLREFLKSEDKDLKKTAIRILAVIDLDNPTTIQNIRELLKDEDNDVRKAAAMALLKINPNDQEALKALSEKNNE